MGHTYHKLWAHLIWSTEDRYPFINSTVKPILYAAIREICDTNDYYLDHINGVEDHVHLLMQLKPKNSISEVIKNIKGISCERMNTLNITKDYFGWQDGFAAYSVSPSQIERVREYIRNQETHHKNFSFATEISRLVELNK